MNIASLGATFIGLNLLSLITLTCWTYELEYRPQGQRCCGYWWNNGYTADARLFRDFEVCLILHSSWSWWTYLREVSTAILIANIRRSWLDEWSVLAIWKRKKLNSDGGDLVTRNTNAVVSPWVESVRVGDWQECGVRRSVYMMCWSKRTAIVLKHVDFLRSKTN